VTLHGRLSGFASSSTHKRPIRMIRRDRQIDNNFSPADHLYHRCVKEDVIDDRLIPSRIRYDDISVNWSRYSKPWDTIFDFPNEGIARFVVKHLPKELPKALPPAPKNARKQATPAALHSFFPSHDPCDDNYAHCEIGTYKNGVRQKRVNLSNTVKKEFRTIMSDNSLVILTPKV
jgi:hypothetical protein